MPTKGSFDLIHGKVGRFHALDPVGLQAGVWAESPQDLRFDEISKCGGTAGVSSREAMQAGDPGCSSVEQMLESFDHNG
jgi:hypothetical protein